MVRHDLELLALTLADWAVQARGTTLYLYGSRVRGDHRPNSDVDVCLNFDRVGEGDLNWWGANNEEGFASINAKLPGRLQILEHNDPLKYKVFAAPVVYQDRNVICVLLPPKVRNV